MKTLKLDNWGDLPENYTGIFDFCGSIYYYLNGLHHREDGPAAIWHNGVLEYYLNGLRHREDGPAIIFSHGRLDYYLNGLRHREDGPAIIRRDGTLEYYLNGINITTEKVNSWIKENNIPEVWDNSHKILFKLTFG